MMYKLKQPNKHIRSLKIINNNLLPYLAKIKNGSIIDKIKDNTKNKYKKNLKIKGCFRLRKKIGVITKISNLISVYHTYNPSRYQSLYQNKRHKNNIIYNNSIDKIIKKNVGYFSENNKHYSFNLKESFINNTSLIIDKKNNYPIINSSIQSVFIKKITTLRKFNSANEKQSFHYQLINKRLFNDLIYSKNRLPINNKYYKSSSVRSIELINNNALIVNKEKTQGKDIKNKIQSYHVPNKKLATKISNTFLSKIHYYLVNNRDKYLLSAKKLASIKKTPLNSTYYPFHYKSKQALFTRFDLHKLRKEYFSNLLNKDKLNKHNTDRNKYFDKLFSIEKCIKSQSITKKSSKIYDLIYQTHQNHIADNQLITNKINKLQKDIDSILKTTINNYTSSHHKIRKVYLHDFS